MKSKKNVVVFTDLDGTLLDDSYSFQEAQPTIKRLRTLGAKIVFCSSKTRSEIEFYRKKLEVNDPFISENGAAIFVPKNYFKRIQACTKQTEPYCIVELGVPYSIIRRAFEEIRKECNCSIIGFGDMTAQEIAEDSGLTINLAKLAKQREYTEPFKIEKGKEEKVFCAIQQSSLGWITGGKYYHLIGHHDKETATIILKKMYEKELNKQLMTVGVGDQPNDLGMLRAVDKPVMVKDNKLGATWESILEDILLQD